VIRRIACQGAPRDLGLDQGRACQGDLRTRAERLGYGASGLLARLRARLDPAARRARSRRAALARDLGRHFPHLAERSAGIARGAGLRVEEVVALLEQELDGSSERAPSAVSLGCSTEAGGVSIELSVAASTAPNAASLIVRESRPDAEGYPTLSLARPWLAGILAGVNGAGLAVACLGWKGPQAADACQAPALYLAEECLARFDRVEKALEWCERRPAGGAALLLFADGSDCAGIEIRARERRRLDGKNAIQSSECPNVGSDLRARADFGDRCRFRINPVERSVALLRASSATSEPVSFVL
jgi:hypothetical protein